MLNIKLPPIALYIHFPWCIKKCPYCDFNSHQFNTPLPEQQYVQSCLEQLHAQVTHFKNRSLSSIFIGGGTPSLMSAETVTNLLTGVDKICGINSSCEITLEANPSTHDRDKFHAFRSAGINRLSIGVQSFDDRMLAAIGRTHNAACAHDAITSAQQSGFEDINVDLMFALPHQTLGEAMQDLSAAVNHQVPHISWYQLTLEPNTAFYHKPPALPSDQQRWDFYTQGQTFLSDAGYAAYEISAYTCRNKCQHNINYWKYGDYLGIGAGAHSKITRHDGRIERFSQIRQPKRYMQSQTNEGTEILSSEQISLEYMMNRLRLLQDFSPIEFLTATGRNPSIIETGLQQATECGYLKKSPQGTFQLTPIGKRFLNDVACLF